MELLDLTTDSKTKVKESQLVLPDLFDMAPFTLSISPHYKEAGAESAAWTDSFGFFEGRVREHFIRSDFELLVALSYPTASYEDFRTMCDYMNSFFVFDNISDEQDREAAAKTANVYVMALKGEACEESRTPFYKFVSEFGSRIREKSLRRSHRRFIQSHTKYVDSVVQEAKIRTDRVQLNFREYIELRRNTIGIPPAFDMMEFMLGIDLPDELFENEAFQKMSFAATDMIFYVNDLVSYKKERVAGLDWVNSLTILMNTMDMSLQEAMDYVGELHRSALRDYIENKKLIPSFGAEVDRDIRAYVRNMDDWVIGNLEWHFRSKRYLGDDNEKVRESRVVTIPL